MPFFQYITISFSEKKMLFSSHQLGLNQLVYWKNIDFLKNSRLNSHNNALNRRKVQNCNETKPFFHWQIASFSEKTIYLQSL